MENKKLDFQKSGLPIFKVFFISCLLSGLFIFGCASPKKKPDYTTSAVSTPAENHAEPLAGVYGPPLPSGGPAPQESQEVYGPNPQTTSQASPNDHPPGFAPNPAPVKRPVVLVLGPGRARSYAYAGVFRALHEKKIPVGAVLGTEMGGLMAALYGASGNINSFEWGLLKLKDEIFLKKEGFFSRLANEKDKDGGRLEFELRQVFEKKDLKDFKILTRLAVQSKETGISFVLSEGNAVQAVRGVVATPELFAPGTWQSQGLEIPVIAASSTRPFLVSEAKKLDIGPVVVISVLTEAERRNSEEELSQADLVISPDLRGLSYQDFKKRNEIAFRGKTAIYEHLTEIQHLAGLQEQGDSQKPPTPAESSTHAR